jgi:hypothetical protein
VCCVLLGRGLCEELITRPEESYRLWHVAVCDHETSWTRRPYPALGWTARENNNSIISVWQKWRPTTYRWSLRWYTILNYKPKITCVPGKQKWPMSRQIILFRAVTLLVTNFILIA